MDNVPLLVSLFTDCTPASTRQMVEIMQEHGEVVAMLGSSANFQNIRSFLVADASLAVEPLYPQVIPCVIICISRNHCQFLRSVVEHHAAPRKARQQGRLPFFQRLLPNDWLELLAHSYSRGRRTSPSTMPSSPAGTTCWQSSTASSSGSPPASFSASSSSAPSSPQPRSLYPLLRPLCCHLCTPHSWPPAFSWATMTRTSEACPLERTEMLNFPKLLSATPAGLMDQGFFPVSLPSLPLIC